MEHIEPHRDYDRFLDHLAQENEDLVEKIAREFILEDIPLFRRRGDFVVFRILAAVHTLLAIPFLGLVVYLWLGYGASLPVGALVAPSVVGGFLFLAAPVFLLIGRHRRKVLSGAKISLSKEHSYLLMALSDREHATLGTAFHDMRHVERIWVDDTAGWPRGQQIKVRLKTRPDIDETLRVPGFSPVWMTDHEHIARRTLQFVQKNFPGVKIGAPEADYFAPSDPRPS